ncbi:hypothetical protein CBR_g18889 [Chara braunii]|uniref:6-phosphogluconate dehydrogenase NADP-binding domain-containing protein n=1 Tax=Chara braunii TaxID=69332 RepID=A0A388KWQ3_CHABU|nr:hypothetical protein CBR_g18889 [Chara braunii]|eukprot:GBG74479.1 hypothetical protein CBR_g18889 [Chara braunii]
MASSCIGKTWCSSARVGLSLSSCVASVAGKRNRFAALLQREQGGRKVSVSSSVRSQSDPIGGIQEGLVCKPSVVTGVPSELARSRRRAGRTSQYRFIMAQAASADGAAGVDSSATFPTVGFLGLGIMGEAMARNLVKAGYDVTVWNRTASKCASLATEGAKVGLLPRDVTEACDITFAMLADPTGALSVACGEHGAVKGLGPGKGYVDISTVDGVTAMKINEAVKATGGEFLEAPVSGSKKPAEDGTLIFMTAGDKALYERASPALDVMGKARFFLGEVGKGAAMKLVVNMVMGSMMASFSEGLALGDKIGLDANTLLEVISLGAINTPMYTLKGPAMVKGQYTPAFPLKHQQKDLRLALALGEEVVQPLPVAAAANEVYKLARAAGLGDADFSAVLETVKSHSRGSTSNDH